VNGYEFSKSRARHRQMQPGGVIIRKSWNDGNHPAEYLISTEAPPIRFGA
jgi:hypothetical protein